MATATVLDERSRRALERARAEGMETFEDVCGKMGWAIPEPPPPPEPHWSEVDPAEPEPPKTRAARKLWRTGFYILSWIDYFGEIFAYQLGITSPKYQYVIDELISIQDEMDAEAEAEQEAVEEAARIEAAAAAAEEEGVGEAVDGISGNVPENEMGYAKADEIEDDSVEQGTTTESSQQLSEV
eukprot:m.89325 g.89325  ORF g.89325 m.89325 type:complete len:184 (+) comp11738_c0_seq1:41-592(+)